MSFIPSSKVLGTQNLKGIIAAVSTAELLNVTYNNGSNGIGATLVSSMNLSLGQIDSFTVVDGNRILLKDQSAQLQNGLYFVNDVGITDVHAEGQITITFEGMSFGTTVTIGSRTYTYVATVSDPHSEWTLNPNPNQQYDRTFGDFSGMINGDPSKEVDLFSYQQDISATGDGTIANPGIQYLTVLVTGTPGNSVVLSTNDPTHVQFSAPILADTGATTFAGGIDSTSFLLTRDTSMDTWAKISPSLFIANAGTQGGGQFINGNGPTGIIGTDPITFIPYSPQFYDVYANDTVRIPSDLPLMLGNSNQAQIYYNSSSPAGIVITPNANIIARFDDSGTKTIDGSSSTPSLGFMNDVNSGWYRGDSDSGGFIGTVVNKVAQFAVGTLTVDDYTLFPGHNDVQASLVFNITNGTSFVTNNGTSDYVRVADTNLGVNELRLSDLSHPGGNAILFDATGTNAQTAQNMTDAINAYNLANPSTFPITAVVAGTQVTLIFANIGVVGNGASYLNVTGRNGTAATDLPITWDGTTGQNYFIGGDSIPRIDVAGHILVEGVDWTAMTDNATTAASIQTAIDNLSEVAVTNITGAVLTIMPTDAGSAGNSLALSSGDSGFTIVPFAGGEDAVAQETLRIIGGVNAPASSFGDTPLFDNLHGHKFNVSVDSGLANGLYTIANIGRDVSDPVNGAVLKIGYRGTGAAIEGMFMGTEVGYLILCAANTPALSLQADGGVFVDNYIELGGSPTASTPNLRIYGDTTGIYGVSNAIRFTVDSTDQIIISSGFMEVVTAMSVDYIGAANDLSLYIGNSGSQGFFTPGTNQLGISTNTNEVARFDDDATAHNTRFMLWDVDSGALQRVSVGVADSGGVGFKLLRIPN